MKLRLLYKSYSGGGVTLRRGEVYEFGEAEAKRLLTSFPDWFDVVFEPKAQKEKGPGIQLVEEVPPAGEAEPAEEAPPPVEAF